MYMSKVSLHMYMYRCFVYVSFDVYRSLLIYFVHMPLLYTSLFIIYVSLIFRYIRLSYISFICLFSIRLFSYVYLESHFAYVHVSSDIFCRTSVWCVRL